jgi:hypothetical protein
MKAFPKIHALGTRHTADIFDGIVEITEKVDGSQFGFGKVNGELFMRSKGKQLVLDHPDKMFAKGVEAVKSIESRIPENYWFWSEYLQRPKHNVLKYDRIPKNHLALFGAWDMLIDQVQPWFYLQKWAEKFEMDIVPRLFQGNFLYQNADAMAQLHIMLNEQSFLGGTKIEGVVIKRYRDHEVAGVIHPIQSGKFVSEKFKEKMGVQVKKQKNTLPDFVESFRTEARWFKAIQHLRDEGMLLHDPKDIGSLIQEIQRDVFEEETEVIKDYLFDHFKPQIQRKVIAGFPEFYKEYLMKECYDGKEESKEAETQEK